MSNVGGFARAFTPTTVPDIPVLVRRILESHCSCLERSVSQKAQIRGDEIAGLHARKVVRGASGEGKKELRIDWSSQP